MRLFKSKFKIFRNKAVHFKGAFIYRMDNIYDVNNIKRNKN